MREYTYQAEKTQVLPMKIPESGEIYTSMSLTNWAFS